MKTIAEFNTTSKYITISKDYDTDKNLLKFSGLIIDPDELVAEISEARVLLNRLWARK